MPDTVTEELSAADIKPSTNAPKIEELESIRGMAALAVVFFHMPLWNDFLDVGVVRNGYLMVDLFFVLSGFVIASAYADNMRNWRDIARFQFLRFGRLYPVHLTILLLFLSMEFLKYHLISSAGLAGSREIPFAQNTPLAFVQHLLLIQATGPWGLEATFNQPAWSISVEFYTYLVFAVTTLLLGRNRNKGYLLFSLLALALLLSGYAEGFRQLLRCLTGFFLGCLVRAAIGRWQFRLPAALCGAALLSIIAFMALKPHQEGPVDFIIFALSAWLILAVVRGREGFVKRLLRSKILILLGAWSYSIYMCHTFILQAVGIFLRRILKFPDMLASNQTWVTRLSTAEAAATVIASVLIVLMASWALNKVIEVPLRKRSRRVAKRLFR